MSLESRDDENKHHLLCALSYLVTPEIHNCFPRCEKAPLKYTDHLLMLHLAFQESRPSWNRNTRRIDLCLHYGLAEWCKCLLSSMIPLVREKEPDLCPHILIYACALTQTCTLCSTKYLRSSHTPFPQKLCKCFVLSLLLMSGSEMLGISFHVFFLPALFH